MIATIWWPTHLAQFGSSTLDKFIMVTVPHTTIMGHLKYFSQNQTKLTDSTWILNTSKGYEIACQSGQRKAAEELDQQVATKRCSDSSQSTPSQVLLPHIHYSQESREQRLIRDWITTYPKSTSNGEHNYMQQLELSRAHIPCAASVCRPVALAAVHIHVIMDDLYLLTCVVVVRMSRKYMVNHMYGW